jgi:hypothetical protein
MNYRTAVRTDCRLGQFTLGFVAVVFVLFDYLQQVLVMDGVKAGLL